MIIALISELDGSLDVNANVVDRELFELKVTNPLPVKLYDVNKDNLLKQLTTGVQVSLPV